MIFNNLELRYLNVSVFSFNAFDLSHCGLIVKCRDPAEADVKTSLLLELVQSRIQSLFFHDKNLVNLEDRDTKDVSIWVSLIM